MSLILSLAPTNESKLSSFPASELVLITGGIVDKQRHLLGEGEGGIATIIVGLVVREENESIECFPSFLTRFWLSIALQKEETAPFDLN
uniref:Uncharacterized protein n=1 Tax=Populus trichocarpa TaxID=3694 RepID=A0A2K2BEH0_POPTR